MWTEELQERDAKRAQSILANGKVDETKTNQDVNGSIIVKDMSYSE